MIERYFPKILKWLLYSTAFVPILYLQIFYSPFLSAKVLFFRTVVLLASAVFLILVAEKKEEFRFGILRNKITWLPGILLAVFYISAYFGLDFYNSFWSDFVRMEGLLTWSHVVALFYLLLLSFDRDDWIRYIKIITISGGIAALYGLGQRMGLEFLVETGLDRAAGTLGNAAFLASYLILTFFLSIYIVRQRLGGKGFWYTVSAVSLLGIIYSGTRGAILALLGTLFVYLLYLVLKSDGKKRMYAGAVLVVIIVGGVLGYVNRESLRESNISIVSRFANIGQEDSTTRSRLYIWSQSVDYIKDKPLLGYGLENFPQIYDSIYDPVVVQEDWFDRTHNIYIDYLISSGFVGFLVYISILLWLLKTLYSSIKDDESNKILFFMVVAYMAQNFFVFDSVSTLIAFYAILAFVISQKVNADTSLLNVRSLGKGFAWLVAVVLIVAIYSVNYVPMRVNYALSEGYKYQIVDEDRYINEMEKGLSYDTFAFKDYAYQNTQIFENQVQNGSVSQSDVIRTYNFVENLLRESIEKRPHDIRLYVYLGNLYEASIQHGIPVDTNPDEIEEYLVRAFEISPKRPEISYMLANLYTRRANLESNLIIKREYEDKALEILKTYDSLVPETASTKLILANILFNNGEFDEAGVYFSLAMENYRKDTTDAERAIAFLLKAERYTETIPFYEYLVSNREEDYTLKLDLAQIYYIDGQIEKANELLQEIQEDSPGTLNINPAFVNEVRNSL